MVLMFETSVLGQNSEVTFTGPTSLTAGLSRVFRCCQSMWAIKFTADKTEMNRNNHH